MKKLLGVMAAGCLLTLLVVVSAHAQDPGTAIRVSIPFDFIVEGKTLPAGQYEVRRINDEPTGLLIQTFITDATKRCFRPSRERSTGLRTTVCSYFIVTTTATSFPRS